MADPDLQIRGGGGCHPHAGGDKGGARYQKTFFSALRASVWSKNKGGPSLDPPLTMATEIKYLSAKNAVVHTGKLLKVELELQSEEIAKG